MARLGLSILRVKRMIRRAVLSDLDAIYNLLVPAYFDESVYSDHLDICPDNCWNYFYNQIANYALIAEIEDKIIGYVSITTGYTVYQQLEADIDFFYIHPDYRGKGISRDLLQKTMEFIALEKCGVTYATSRSKTDEGLNNALWENLYKKFGFETAGSMMIRFGE